MKNYRYCYFLIYLFLVIIFYLLYVSLIKLPIENIILSGNCDSSIAKQIQTTVATDLKDRYFLTLNIDRLRKNLEQIPWVDHLTIQRIWPNTLFLNFTLQRPVALLNQQEWVNEYGERVSIPPDQLYNQPKLVNTLPHFFVTIQPTDNPKINNKINNKNSKIIDNIDSTDLISMLGFYQQIAPMFMKIDHSVATVKRMADGSWELVLNNGTLISLGSHEPLEILQRFIKIYPRVIKNDKRFAQQISLQYKGGMAIEWKDE